MPEGVVCALTVILVPVTVEPLDPADVAVGFSLLQPCTKRPAAPMSVGMSGEEVWLSTQATELTLGLTLLGTVSGRLTVLVPMIVPPELLRVSTRMIAVTTVELGNNE